MTIYSIGDLSRLAGVKVTTIRFYEQRGVMPEPGRSLSGQRRYDEAALQRLTFIRHARDLGFDLDDIVELASLTDSPDQSCLTAHEIADRQRQAVERRLLALQALKKELDRMIVCCKGGEVGDCRLIEVLGDHALCISATHRSDEG